MTYRAADGAASLCHENRGLLSAKRARRGGLKERPHSVATSEEHRMITLVVGTRGERAPPSMVPTTGVSMLARSMWDDWRWLVPAVMTGFVSPAAAALGCAKSRFFKIQSYQTFIIDLFF